MLAKEERTRGDEESKAHAPEVTREALPAGNPAASEHVDISSGGEQEDEAEEEAHASGGAFVGSGVMKGLDAAYDDGSSSAETDEKRGPVKPACVSAAASEPGSSEQVEGDDTAVNVAALGFQNREIEAAGGQGEHRNSEDVSEGAVQTAAFADGHSDSAGEQAYRATENMQSQEWEPHASISLRTEYAVCDREVPRFVKRLRTKAKEPRAEMA